jgi:16S rRNA (cytosine967-C5)-methyltransferase
MRVLELCSAPGNKSMFIADICENITIKGVEISNNRANVMKNLIKKYNLDKRIEVIVEDGLKYDSEELFDRVLVDAECTHEGSLKHIYKFFQG